MPISSTPVCPVTGCGPAGAAMPKSSTFAPVSVSITFAGLMSRCTTPMRCAAASAPATCPAVRTASGQASGPPASRSASVCPSTSSITRYGTTTPLSSVASP